MGILELSCCIRLKVHLAPSVPVSDSGQPDAARGLATRAYRQRGDGKFGTCRLFLTLLNCLSLYLCFEEGQFGHAQPLSVGEGRARL